MTLPLMPSLIVPCVPLLAVSPLAHSLLVSFIHCTEPNPGTVPAKAPSLGLPAC